MPADPSRGSGAEAYCPHCERSFAPGNAVCPEDGTELVQFSAQPEQLIGTVLAERFEITARLGAGGMASVYRARQTSVGRDVAVKVIDPKLSRDRDTAKRFLREAKLASRLNQPNSVVVHDFGQHDGTLFIVMELVEGRTLRELLAETGALPAGRIRRIGAQLCDALEAAHSMGVIHRDLKPSNIMVLDKPAGRDAIKVLDFGLAKSLVGETTATSITQSGAIMGTPLYMAPEMIAGQVVDERADIYSLGCILHEMAHGAPPFTAPTTSALFAKHLTEEPARLDRPDLGALTALIPRMLEKDRERRPRSVTEVRDELLGATAAHDTTQPPSARPPNSLATDPTLTAASSAQAAAAARATAAPRRSPWLAIAAVLTAVACGALVWWRATADRGSDASPTPGRGDMAAHAVTPIASPADAAPAAAAAAATSDAAPGPAHVTMLVESVPAADLYADGKKQSRTPAQLAGTRGDEVYLELRRNGYHTLRTTVTLTDQALRFELRRRTRDRGPEPQPQPDDAPPAVDFIPGR